MEKNDSCKRPYRCGIEVFAVVVGNCMPLYVML